MEASFGRQSVSIVVVLCMLMTSVAMLFSAFALGETVYQAPVTHVDGDEKTANLGMSVTIMDLDGDHIGDLVVGVPYASAYGLSKAGAVRIYLSSGGLLVMNGTHEGDLFGWCVANVSDVNGDGWSDLAVGAPLADPETSLVDAGNVSIFYGWSGFDGKPNVTIDGVTADQEFGSSISTAGDIMVDGMDDIIVGSPFYDYGAIKEAGRVDIFYGGDPMNSVADRTFYGGIAEGHFGWAVAGGVNIDQDATMDMVVGAPGVPVEMTAGLAHIYRNLNRANPTLNVVTAKAADDGFGSSVALIRDLNADTFGEVAIGAPYNDDAGSNAGSVAIILGASKFRPTIDVTLVGSPNEGFGWSIASGNILLDRYSDILVGAPNSLLNATPDTPVGRAYAYYGGSAWTEPNLTLVPDAGASFFGGCVAIGDNLTGDPAPDFAVGDPMFNLVGLENAGRVYVYAGAKPSIPYVPKDPVVEGHVYIPGTTTGLPGFTVTLESSNVSNNKLTTTNALGFYQMTAVPGTYWLNSSKADYVANSTTVTLAMDDVRTEDFHPMKIPIVTGVVKDDVTASLEGAKVALYDWTTLITVVSTPANGSFWIPLPIAYVPPEGSSVTLTLKAWDQTHYTTPSNFTIARNETRWVNFTLDRFPEVTGTVRDAIDFSAVRGMVTANQGDIIIAITATDIRGTYTLTAVNASEPARLFLNVTATGHYRTPGWVDVQKNGTYTLNFLLQRDNTKPTSQLTALAQYTATPTVTLSATSSDTDIKEIQLWYKNETAGSYSKYGSDSTSPYSFSFDSSTTGGDGIYEFYSIAVDWADNAENAPGTNDTWTIVDTQVPVLSIASPVADQMFAVATVDVSWIGSDLASGIASFFARLDGGSWIDRENNLSVTFSDLAEGNHTAEVNATDRAGHFALASVTFMVDTVRPEVTITAPMNNSALTSASITLQWSASDAGSGIKTLNVSRDGTAWESVNVNSSEFVFYGPSGIAEGAYTLYVAATDRAGLTTTASVNVVLDRTNPTVTITFPRMNQELKESKVTVGWAMLDAGSGVSHVSISIDGGAFTSVGTETSYDITDLDGGAHNVTVRVTDHAGNYAETSVEFTVSTGGGISSMVIAAIVVVIIVAIAAAVLLVTRKKKAEPEKKEPKK